MLVNQHVVWFDVAVDNVMCIMCILQSIGNLRDILHDGRQWQLFAIRMTCTQ